MKTPSFQKALKSAVELVKQSRKIIVACHMNPDGDAIGSMLGLGLGLMKMKKQVVMLCSDPIPARYITLPFTNRIKQEYRDIADLAISVDCGSLVQLAKLEKAFENSKRIIEIDHHLYRTRFGDLQLVDHLASSAGEIVYWLLSELKVKMDKQIGECLLLSSLVETSSFSRQDVRPATFDLCSQIMRLGVDFHEVSRRYYWSRRLSAVKLSGLCFTRVVSRANNQLVWSIIYKDDFKRFGGGAEDVDPVADEMLMIKEAKVSILFREVDGNLFRVSLRSRDNINIGYLASLYGGGGHKNIAGCRIHNNPRTIEKFVTQAGQLIPKRSIKEGLRKR